VGIPYLDYRAKDATYDQAPWWMTAQPDIDLAHRTGAHCIGFLNLLLAQMGAPRRCKGTGYLWHDLRFWHRPLTETEGPQFGDLLLRCFRSNEDQGHVALLLPQGLVHCYWLPLCAEETGDGSELEHHLPKQPGVALDATWETSHAWCVGGYYEARVPFEDWTRWAFGVNTVNGV
jgi:hypothetical protein